MKVFYHQTNNVENDGGIKFHDPNEFRTQEPQKLTGVNPGLKQTNEQPQKPQPAGYGNTGSGVFKQGGTKLERFLTKNQHTQRK